MPVLQVQRMFPIGTGEIKGVMMNIQNVHWVLVDFEGYNVQAEWAFTDSTVWALAFMHQPPHQVQQVSAMLHGQQVSSDAACCPFGSAPSCTSRPQMGSRGLPRAVWRLMSAACPAP